MLFVNCVEMLDKGEFNLFFLLSKISVGVEILGIVDVEKWVYIVVIFRFLSLEVKGINLLIVFFCFNDIVCFNVCIVLNRRIVLLFCLVICFIVFL